MHRSFERVMGTEGPCSSSADIKCKDAKGCLATTRECVRQVFNKYILGNDHRMLYFGAKIRESVSQVSFCQQPKRQQISAKNHLETKVAKKSYTIQLAC